jgi:hypothetical protein
MGRAASMVFYESYPIYIRKNNKKIAQIKKSRNTAA